MTKIVQIRSDELGDENPLLKVISIEDFEYEFGNLIFFADITKMPWNAI